MFDGCVSLTSIDLSGFDTKNVINLGLIFDNCQNLLILIFLLLIVVLIIFMKFLVVFFNLEQLK